MSAPSAGPEAGPDPLLPERSPLQETRKLVLTLLPCMLSELTTSMIRKALENVHPQNVDNWAREH